MKNNYVISGILAAALILLYILHFTSKSNNSSGQVDYKFASDDSIALPIAYVNIDSLLMNYNFAKDLREQITRSEEDVRASLNQRERQVQTAANEFQRKLENNAFLSQQRAEEEQRRIQKMVEDLQKTAQQKENELEIEGRGYHYQMFDSVNAVLKDFNKNRNFEVILSNTASDNILLAHPKYDITDEIVVLMNKRYGPATSAPESKK
jgi:outer membrane protein